MSDLKVDYEVLESSASTVKTLKSEFDALKDNVGAQSGDWGSGDISGAMSEFAGNWDYRRDILSGKLQEVGEKIESTIEAFTKADKQLAQQLEDAMSGKDGGE